MLEGLWFHTLITSLWLTIGLHWLSHRVVWLVPLVTVCAACLASAIWLLHYQPQHARRLYQRSCVARVFITLLCRLTRRQVPSPPQSGSQSSTALPSTAVLQQAHQVLQARVHGCSECIDELLSTLEATLVPRRTVKDLTVATPLGVFLFVGEEGIGKRTLATMLGSQVLHGPVLTLNLQTQQQATTRILEAVKLQPLHMIILEHIDRASPALVEQLQVITAGEPVYDPQTHTMVRFDHCVIVLVFHDAAQWLRQLRSQPAIARHEIAQRTKLPLALVTRLHGWWPFTLPPPAVQAEVAALLLRAAGQQMQLPVRVAPPVIAQLVQEVSQSRSFAILPGLIEHLLRQPIAQTMTQQGQILVLNDALPRPSATVSRVPSSTASTRRRQKPYTQEDSHG